MSVIREPGRFSHHTRTRVVGVTAAAAAAAVETLAVGLWFVFVVVEPRATSTALAGLGILFCGALLRTSIFGTTTTTIQALLTPRRIGVSLVLVAAWPLWILIAETVGGQAGLALAGLVLATTLTLQFVLERRAFHLSSTWRCRLLMIGGAILVASGATLLLAATWFSSWSAVSDPIQLGSRSVFLIVEAYQLGLLAFGICAFVAHQRRFHQLLEY